MNIDTPEQLAKRQAGIAAAGLVTGGMRVGLGTGSTTEFAIHALAARIRSERLEVQATPTSYATERLARELSIPLVTLDDVDELEIAIDGADEVDPSLNLIKGRGGAHTRERVVASLSRKFVILVDESKLVSRLGEKSAVPVEVLPMALNPVSRTLIGLGGRPELRVGGKKDGPVVTDQGFWIIDCKFDKIDDPSSLAAEVRAIPGVLDHGIFVGMATDVLVGSPDGVQHKRRPA